MVSGFWFDSKKEKFGRSPGSGLNEPDTFLWDQGNAYADNKFHGLWKLEVDQTFSPNFFVSAKAAYYNTGFGLIGRNKDQSYTYDYVQQVTVGTYYDYYPVRPQKSLNLDGSYFFQGAGGNHELKFGFGYREVSSDTTIHWNGNQLVGYINGPTDYVARVYRDQVASFGAKYADFYVGDVYTKDRLSVNVGIRWDQQKAKNNPTEAPADASFPELVPALQYAGDSQYPIDWKDWSPRVGLSYSLDDARKTVLRASYARYASQLSFGQVTDENPVSAGYLAYAWNDANGDRLVQPGEVLTNQYLYNYNIDPANPAAVGTTPNKIDRNYTSTHTNEAIVGIDHELLPNFALGLAYTYRRIGDLPYRPRIGGTCPTGPTLADCTIIQPDQYTAGAPVTSGGYTVVAYAPDPALVTAGGSGRLRTNLAGYTQNFNGLEMTLVKRLSNKWMGRVAFSWNAFKQHYSGITPVQLGGGTQGGIGAPPNGNPTPTDRNSLTDDLVGAVSGGSGRATYYTTPAWQIYANALVQLPWSLDLSGAVFGRQGQVEP
jgi:hypothetical protein